VRWAVESLGSRVCFAVSSTAPTSPEVIKYFTDIVGVPVIDLYGSTVSQMMVFLETFLMPLDDF